MALSRELDDSREWNIAGNRFDADAIGLSTAPLHNSALSEIFPQTSLFEGRTRFPVPRSLSYLRQKTSTWPSAIWRMFLFLLHKVNWRRMNTRPRSDAHKFISFCSSYTFFWLFHRERKAKRFGIHSKMLLFIWRKSIYWVPYKTLCCYLWFYWAHDREGEGEA